MRLIEGVLLTISPAEKDLVVNPYFKKELRIYSTISMELGQRRAMVTSGLGSDLVYVEKTENTRIVFLLESHAASPFRLSGRIS